MLHDDTKAPTVGKLKIRDNSRLTRAVLSKDRKNQIGMEIDGKKSAEVKKKSYHAANSKNNYKWLYLL